MDNKDSRPLTWGDMKNFKWSEISNFTWGDILKNRDQLLKEIDNGEIEVPHSVYKKIETLCGELSIKDPRVKKGMTIGDACSIINAIINTLDKLPAIVEKYSPMIIDLLEKLFNSH